MAFISLNIEGGKVIKGSEQQSDSVRFMNPSQNSMQRDGALFCFPLLWGEVSKRKCPETILAAFYVTPFWSQGSKQTIWNAQTLVSFFLFSTMIETFDGKGQIDSKASNVLPA